MIGLLICLVIKKINTMANELFIRGRTPNIFHFFNTQSYFAVPKNIRPNSMHYFATIIPNKQELQQLVFNR